MIGEQQLFDSMQNLQIEVLYHWIDLGLVEPQRDANGYLFDDVDEARITLIYDLHYGMGLEHDSLPIILSLVDQLHQTRHHLRAITAAVTAQPEDIKVAIASRTRFVIGGGTADDAGFK